MKNALSVAILLFGLASAPALAWGHGHGHGGYYYGPRVIIGAPYYPYYYQPVVPYYAPIVTVPAPPVYIQQPPQTQQSWFYCASSRAYYPYVRECPEDWQRVAPQPSAPPPPR